MIKAYLFSSTVFCMLMSCHPDKYYTWFTINNNSSKGICYAYSNKYPDYLPSGAAGAPSIVIQPGTGYSLVQAGSLDSYFTSVRSDTLELFIFDARVVQTVPWDSVLAKYLILKRYDLTLDSIRKMKNVINYP